jgi:hypothetical protein
MFKQTGADVVPTINTTRTGLTGTTEQIVIKNEKGTVMDALCWFSSKPTESEITDINDLYEQEAWISNTAGSCIPSDEVETNGTVQRKSLTDTNSLSDWEIINPQDESNPQTTSPDTDTTSSPSSNPANVEEEATNEASNSTTEDEASTLQIDELPTSDEDAQDESEPVTISSLPKTTKKTTAKKSSSTSTKKSTTKKTQKKSTKKTYLNGDESQDIHINEVMPNPSEPDQQNEWIELINTGDANVNLGNWQLDDDEGGSKPYIIPDTVILEPNTPLLIPITESKISLANKQDKVRILNFNDELIDEVTYQDAGEDMSFARITISEETSQSSSTQQISWLQNYIPQAMAQENTLSATETARETPVDSEDPQSTELQSKDTWMWVKNGTPGDQNPTMQKIQGTIIEEPQFTPPYSFKLQTPNHVLEIFFNEETIKAPLAASLFTKNTPIDLLLKPDENGDLWLEKYEVLGTNAPTNDFNIFPWLAIGLVMSGCGTFMYLQKKLPWQKNKATTTQKIVDSV